MITNRVADSGIITLDLAVFFPKEEDLKGIEFNRFLFQDLILKEKEYREMIKQFDFTPFQNKYIFIYLMNEVIIPQWAYMLLSDKLIHFAKGIFFGSKEEAKHYFFLKQLNAFNTTPFIDQRVVVKGCGEIAIPEMGYIIAAEKLLPVVKSLMYGEACSAVPIYKRSKI